MLVQHTQLARILYTHSTFGILPAWYAAHTPFMIFVYVYVCVCVCMCVCACVWKGVLAHPWYEIHISAARHEHSTAHMCTTHTRSMHTHKHLKAQLAHKPLCALYKAHTSLQGIHVSPRHTRLSIPCTRQSRLGTKPAPQWAAHSVQATSAATSRKTAYM